MLRVGHAGKASLKLGWREIDPFFEHSLEKAPKGIGVAVGDGCRITAAGVGLGEGVGVTVAVGPKASAALIFIGGLL